MSAIYIHIPFCKSACNYCNFHFVTSLRYKNNVVQAIAKEMVLQQEFFMSSQSIETVYFGGGTPSLMTREDLSQLLHALRQNFLLAPNAEITLEINPDDLSSDALASWTELGFNRYGLGVQSFFEEDLRYLNRAHSASQALQSLELLQREGIQNFSTDLIFGIPTGSVIKTKNNLQRLIELKVPHISCYSLTVEPHTPLFKLIAKQSVANINQEQQAEEFLAVMELLTQHQYEHYEISNYALPNHRSKHNTNYWNNKPYLGLGPGAHSYNGTQRQWNCTNNHTYVNAINNQIIPFEQEVLTPQEQYNEYVMTQLRRIEGLNINTLQQEFAPAFYQNFLTQLHNIHPQHYVLNNQQTLQLTTLGKLYCDAITRTLFMV